MPFKHPHCSTFWIVDPQSRLAASATQRDMGYVETLLGGFHGNAPKTHGRHYSYITCLFIYLFHLLHFKSIFHGKGAKNCC